MHRRLTFHGQPGPIRELARELPAMEGVITIEHRPAASVKPGGDVLVVDVLNRAADEVLRRAQPRLDDEEQGMVLLVSPTSAMVDPRHREQIHNDADEMLWEEMEAGLRNHGRLSANYMLLMAIGGAIASMGLKLDTVSQAIAFVGASIIAPAFEPIAKVAQSLVLRNFRVTARALLALAVGYGVLFAAAFVVFVVLSHGDTEHHRALLRSEEVIPALMLRATPLVTSAGAAIAGVLMVVSLRDVYVVGPLMVLVLIPGVALAAAALAVGDPWLAGQAARRVAADLGLVLVLGGLVFLWKQRGFHRRRSLS